MIITPRPSFCIYYLIKKCLDIETEEIYIKNIYSKNCIRKVI